MGHLAFSTLLFRPPACPPLPFQVAQPAGSTPRAGNANVAEGRRKLRRCRGGARAPQLRPQHGSQTGDAPGSAGGGAGTAPAGTSRDLRWRSVLRPQFKAEMLSG